MDGRIPGTNGSRIHLCPCLAGSSSGPAAPRSAFIAQILYLTSGLAAAGRAMDGRMGPRTKRRATGSWCAVRRRFAGLPNRREGRSVSGESSHATMNAAAGLRSATAAIFESLLMYKRILVPVDGSAVSLMGLQQAVRFAKDQRAHLRIIHVIDEAVLAEYPDLVDTTGQRSEERRVGKQGGPEQGQERSEK